MHDPSTEGREHTLYGIDMKRAYLLHMTKILARQNKVSSLYNSSNISGIQYSGEHASLLATAAVFKWILLSTIVLVGSLANSLVALGVFSDRQLQSVLGHLH
jgi:hypothetical protein